MAIEFYWLGVFLALLAGSTTQLGSVFQKKAVNEMTYLVIGSDLKFWS